MEINLISDTVTKPTREMLSFMMEAEVGDDVFMADPTVIKLQEKLAKMFGMQDALFFPSGTMANQTAIKLHTKPADQLICDKWAHVYNYEGGGAAFNSGVSCSLIDGSRGMFRAEQVKYAVHDPENIHIPETTLVAVENTTNKGGGACWDYNELIKIKNVCNEYNMAYHLDGARLFNAMVEKNETPKDYGKLFDTISICLSKGLGAPVGSVLLGSKEHIKKALRIRKLFGGAMRQCGYLAAAGIYALDHHIMRLKEDHLRAKKIGEILSGLSYVSNIEKIETNILIFNLDKSVSENEFIEFLNKHSIYLISMGEGKLRLVTHLDFTDKMLDKLEQVLKKFKV
ncbi:threonine aldolase family protein [Namhaeicola litoreus]|uniref:Threonine aldolase family protein n=1 Tax=Namhaeicola litoreus TaxID=1052145 RepID=A0ABW3Y200_9FLAO